MVANEEQIGVLYNLKEIKVSLQKIAAFFSRLQLSLERVTSITIEFDDISMN
jgi:DNA repair protein RecN (Recombination protein N)